MTGPQTVRRGPLRRPWASALIAIAALVAIGATIAATSGAESALHTRLEESRPTDGETVTDPVTEVWLRFSTAVQPGLSTLALTHEDGSVVMVGTLVPVDGSESMQLRAPVSAVLAAGRYSVDWATAGPDSHIIEGSFTFVVQATETEPQPPVAATQEGASDSASAASAPAAQSSSEDMASGEFIEATAPLGLAARWLSFLGATLLIGIAAFRFAVVGAAQRRGEADAVATFLPRLRGYGYLVTTLAVVAALLKLADAVMSFGVARLGPLLFGSPWGLSWWLFTVGVVAGFFGIRLTGKSGTRAPGWRLLAIGGVLTAVSMPFAGHGWAGPIRAVTVPSHILHTLGVGVWFGGLGVLVLVALPFLARRKDADGRSAEAPAWVASFSRMALIGVALLMVTGALNSWQHVGGIGAMFGTGYGRTLMVKNGLFLVACLLGLYNWRQARPALDETGRPGILRLPATFELIVGAGVLLVTAVLVAMHLPG